MKDSQVKTRLYRARNMLERQARKEFGTGKLDMPHLRLYASDKTWYLQYQPTFNNVIIIDLEFVTY